MRSLLYLYSKSSAKSFKHILFSIGSDQSTAFVVFVCLPKAAFHYCMPWLLLQPIFKDEFPDFEVIYFSTRFPFCRQSCLSYQLLNFKCIHQSSCSAGLTVDQIATTITCINSCGQSMFLAHVLDPSNLLSTFLWL